MGLSAIIRAFLLVHPIELSIPGFAFSKESDFFLFSAMRDSKLYYYLSHLSEAELADFRKYLLSPIIGVNESYPAFFDLFCQLVLPGPIPKDQFFSAVHQSLNYKDSTTTKALTEMVRLVEEYLAFAAFQEDRALKDFLLISSKRKRKMDKFFPKTFQSARQQLADLQQELTPDQSLLHSYQMDKKWAEYLFSQPKRDQEFSLSSLNLHLDHYYLLEKLHLLCGSLVQKRIVPTDQESRAIELIFQLLEHQSLESVPAIQLYRLILNLLTHPDQSENFFAAKAKVLAGNLPFPPSYTRELFYYLINYCTQKANQGEKAYRGELVELYTAMESQGLMLEGATLNELVFKNIVFLYASSADLDLNNLELAHNFIETYAPHLDTKDPQRQALLVEYNQGVLFYFGKKYQEATQIFNRVLREFQDIFYELDSRVFLCKSYYELGDFELLETELERSRKKFQRTKELVPQRQKNYLAFIQKLKILAKIAQAPLQDQPKQFLSFKEKIGREGKILNKNWLFQKIEEGLAATKQA